jgi:hypothetical protein
MVPILPTLIEPHDLLPPLLCPRYAPRRLARRNGLLVVNSVLNVLRLNSRWVRNHLRVEETGDEEAGGVVVDWGVEACPYTAVGSPASSVRASPVACLQSTTVELWPVTARSDLS